MKLIYSRIESIYGVLKAFLEKKFMGVSDALLESTLRKVSPKT